MTRKSVYICVHVISRGGAKEVTTDHAGFIYVIPLNKTRKTLVASPVRRKM